MGIFNPKLLSYDNLENIDLKILLNIKTSAWLNQELNEIYIISQVPKTIQKYSKFRIIRYKDHNENWLHYNLEHEDCQVQNTVYNTKQVRTVKSGATESASV